MRCTAARKGLKGAIFFIALGVMVSCAGGRIQIGWPSKQAPPPPAGKHGEKKGGPPPHAPAHGYRAKHQYRYYPSAEIYYDPVRASYFYFEGGSWRMSVSLPRGLRVTLGEYVEIEMDSDKPYERHVEHREKYPPGRRHKEKKKKWKDKKKQKGGKD